jgi:hypothetical protein
LERGIDRVNYIMMCDVWVVEKNSSEFWLNSATNRCMVRFEWIKKDKKRTTKTRIFHHWLPHDCLSSSTVDSIAFLSIVAAPSIKHPQLRRPSLFTTKQKGNCQRLLRIVYDVPLFLFESI